MRELNDAGLSDADINLNDLKGKKTKFNQGIYERIKQTPNKKFYTSVNLRIIGSSPVFHPKDLYPFSSFDENHEPMLLGFYYPLMNNNSFKMPSTPLLYQQLDDDTKVMHL